MDQEKGKIIAVGHVINGIPENWQFDCEERVPALTITADGQMLYAGYSLPELEEISRDFWRRK